MKLVINIFSRIILLSTLIFKTPLLLAQPQSDQHILLRKVGTIPLTPDRVHTLATYPLNYNAQVIAYRNLYHDSTQLLYAPVIITGRYGKGKVIYIDVWATWCGPCIAEMPSLELLKDDLKKDTSIVFVSLSVDTDINAWKSFLSKKKMQGLQWWNTSTYSLKDYLVRQAKRTSH